MIPRSSDVGFGPVPATTTPTSGRSAAPHDAEKVGRLRGADDGEAGGA